MITSPAESRIYAEYESRREADELADDAGYVECADCRGELHSESEEAIVLLGEVRCPDCTISLAVQAWRDPASWAAYSLAEKAEILDVLGTECNRAEAEIRRQIREGKV